MVILEINNSCSDFTFDSTPVGIEDQVSFSWVFRNNLIVAFHCDLPLLDDHFWRGFSWCLDECLSTLPVPRQSSRGSCQASARFPGCPSIGVHPDQSLWSAGRPRSIERGTASAGPVRSRRAVSLTRRFIWIATGGRCNSAFGASAAVVLNAPLIRHAARFWIATNG